MNVKRLNGVFRGMCEEDFSLLAFISKFVQTLPYKTNQTNQCPPHGGVQLFKVFQTLGLTKKLFMTTFWMTFLDGEKKRPDPARPLHHGSWRAPVEKNRSERSWK